MTEISDEPGADSEWFANFYHCPKCKHHWVDHWDCAVDDDCPRCGCRHISPSVSLSMEELAAMTEPKRKSKLSSWR